MATKTKATTQKTKLKSYAPQARLDFIAAVKARAAKFGISKAAPLAMEEKGDLVFINGQPFPKKIGTRRKTLLTRIETHGFEQTMEEIAYTWFNRFLAIRYMELHGFLDHGFRVLSHPEGGNTPEILEQAEHTEFEGLDKDTIIDLKLAGDKDVELYNLLLIAQCNALHTAMPFLFEKIDDETELLLPDNLLHTDSLIRTLVTEIAEQEWQNIEIIGWLYQYYISEKKDAVIGKVVKSEDIPAATQLFTPNWIVKYMVQNSLGAQWMSTYPQSTLKANMDYYIEPAAQAEEVQQQLAKITPQTLDPETITLIDPAAGSGHILVEAYDLFKAIYLERGYRLRDIPRLILEKNLYGLDIDARAAQMAGFALLMKARADDRRILSKPVRLNVKEIVSTQGMDAQRLARYVLTTKETSLLAGEDLFPDSLAQPALQVDEDAAAVTAADIASLITLFEQAKTFGSLLTVPENLAAKLPALLQLVQEKQDDDSLAKLAKNTLLPVVQQADILARHYDNVVANPPYIGGKGQNGKLKAFLKEKFKDVKSDVFSAFMVRNGELAKPNGQLGFMTPFVWMFISSYEKLRGILLDQKHITTLIQLEYSGFDGATVPICTFTYANGSMPDYKGGYVRLSDFKGAANQAPKTLEAIANPDCGWFFHASAADFKKIPGSPVAYWAGNTVFQVFERFPNIGSIAKPMIGMRTGDNERFLRLWFEVAREEMGLGCETAIAAKDSERKWFPYNKGGGFRKWYGNNEFVLNWRDNGYEVKSATLEKYPQLDWDNLGWKISNEKFFFQPSVTWTATSSSYFGVRTSPAGYIFDVKGSSCFPSNTQRLAILGNLASKPTREILKMLNPTIEFQPRDIGNVPYVLLPSSLSGEKIEKDLVPRLVNLSNSDWDAYETSWDFQRLPLLHPDHHQLSLPDTYKTVRTHWQSMTDEMKLLEEENNRLFIDAYGLQDELTPDVPLKEITLTCNPHYRYGGDKSEDELEALLLTDTMKELISYAIGCMMGRYSLTEPGLVYAHAGNEGFDPSRYGDFPADDDGIIPLTDRDWFDDDATRRFEEFIKLTWPEENLQDNLAFIAAALKKKGEADPLATIRNYMSRGFYKDHLQTYKNRPIYWLFSSGKLKAFECLVYLHRYNEGTLSRMRMEYVIPLQSRFTALIDQLDDDIAAASTTPERKRKEKEQTKLKKQQDELRNFDEQLRHHTDHPIALDLDDGVRVNYAKFTPLLAEKIKVCGKPKKEDG